MKKPPRQTPRRGRVARTGSLRHEILDAARDILVTDGYNELSMRHVADRIGYSPTAIYLHFKDKQDLVFCMCEETFGALIRELDSLDREFKDPLARLKHGMRRYVDFGLKHPQHYVATFVIRFPEAADPKVAARYHDEASTGMRALGILGASVAACVERGTLRKVDVAAATRALWATIHGITSLLIAFPEFTWGDRDALITMVIDAAVDGLRPRR